LRSRSSILPLIVVAFQLIAADGTSAQIPAGRDASVTAGATFGDGDTALATTVAVGFRPWRLVGVALELAHAPKLDFVLDRCPPPLVCIVGGRVPVTGRTVSLIPHVMIELLPASHRARAYVTAGIGAGHVRQRYTFGFAGTSSLTERVESTRSSLTAAYSFGGGILLPVTARLALGADLRSLHLADDMPTPERFILPAGMLSTLRVGVRLNWTF